jgi:tripeptidyl-peptidase-1
MLGLRGISIITASGDVGVGATCQSNTPTGNTTSPRPEFTPQFPATCPYITSVGGTQFSPSTTTNANIEIEAWPSSSGGFSNYFRRAWFQDSAVQNYLDHHLPNETREYLAQFANFSGRGFPDLSAHSLNPYYSFFAAGRRDTVGGTSAAAPVVAGLVALLNSARLKTGRPTMGFLNPWLYSLGSGSRNASLGLVDVTMGASVGCTGLSLQSQSPVPSGMIPGAMWNATVGWDPVTGLGYPDLRAWTREAMP